MARNVKSSAFTLDYICVTPCGCLVDCCQAMERLCNTPASSDFYSEKKIISPTAHQETPGYHQDNHG